jgi:molybdenum cofactor biosynthesis protein B
MGTKKHKAGAPVTVKVGIVTVSSTRTLKDDKSGLWISKQLKKQRHKVVFHEVVPDDAEIITRTVMEAVNVIKPEVLLISGGTGITSKDVTVEAVRPLFEKELTAFGPLFSQFSFEEIDSAALLSRATAGVYANTIIFCMPGSLNACKLACKMLIFPELGHLVGHLQEN